EQWKRLYELMGKLRDLAPWEYMYEDNIFGVQFPETGNLGFVSVMGSLGEHFAIAVYMGKKGLEGFLTMQRMAHKLAPDIVLQVPQLQASFENREMIAPEDRKIIKQLDLKFRGKNVWPQFRSYRPGCFPWYLEKEEAQMLIHGLEQLMDVAPRFKQDADMLGSSEPDGKLLVRVQENGEWVDRPQKIKFPADPPLRLSMNMDALNELRSMKKRNATVEVDIQMMEEAVRDKSLDRPYFPFMLMIAEKESHMILGVDLLSPLPSLEEMWETVPEKVTEILANYLLPGEIQTKDPLIAMLLSPLEKELGVKVNLVKRLPTIEHAKREFRKLTGGEW
ncbi:MAG: DUF7309 domain-containing protein, partial [Anaerolineales bacterium]